jgi:hypothetical protein
VISFLADLVGSISGCGPSLGMAPTVTHDPTTLAVSKAVEHWSLTTIREKLVKIGAKVVAHDRCVTFQMAEVAVPDDVFRGILRQIDGMRRPSLAAG